MTPWTLLPEWQPQHAIIITWPHPYSGWKHMLLQAENCYINLTRTITAHQRLLIICYSLAHQQHVQQCLRGVNQHNLGWAIIPTNDTWVRDYGPLTAKKNDKLYWLNFNFNAWGLKFGSHLDTAVNAALIQHPWFAEKYTLQDVPYTLEGGAVEVNGAGFFLSTHSVIHNPNRSNNTAITSIAQQYFNCPETLILEQGHLAGDDTDGHIDTLVRFFNKDSVLYCACHDSADEHYLPLQKMRQALERTAFTLVPLPLPDPRYDAYGERLPGTYANFLIGQEAVYAPIYGCPQDAEALDTLQQCFKNYKILPVDCNALIVQRGSLHCSTMQIPVT